MKIPISVLHFIVMTIFDIRGLHARSNLSQLESKICNGQLAKQNERKYMASLQLDGEHICSAGMFKKHFLLTTAGCVRHIQIRMKNNTQKATAVLGDMNLRKGQRVDIVNIAYHPRFENDEQLCSNNFCDIGVVMLADTVDYTLVDILELYKKRTNIGQHGRTATVCGWSRTRDYDNKECGISEEEHPEDEDSENLHCVKASLLSRTICTPSIPHGDYYLNLLCGIPNFSNATITLGDVGSPLTKIISANNEYETYIVGVTLHTYKTKQDTFLRFIRSSIIHEYIDMLIRHLQAKTKANAVSKRSSQQSPTGSTSKRLKI